MPQEQKPRRYNFSSRLSYKQELGKWEKELDEQSLEAS